MSVALVNTPLSQDSLVTSPNVAMLVLRPITTTCNNHATNQQISTGHDGWCHALPRARSWEHDIVAALWPPEELELWFRHLLWPSIESVGSRSCTNMCVSMCIHTVRILKSYWSGMCNDTYHKSRSSNYSNRPGTCKSCTHVPRREVTGVRVDLRTSILSFIFKHHVHTAVSIHDYPSLFKYGNGKSPICLV